MALAERFGWTWDELYDQDMSQVIPAVAAANLYAAVSRVHGWMQVAAQGIKVPLPSRHDLAALSTVKAAQKELKRA